MCFYKLLLLGVYIDTKINVIRQDQLVSLQHTKKHCSHMNRKANPLLVSSDTIVQMRHFKLDEIHGRHLQRKTLSVVDIFHQHDTCINASLLIQ